MKRIFFLLIILALFSCQSGNKKSVNESKEVAETTVAISGMHCENCVASVEKGINGLEGITSVVVSLNDSNAVVKYDEAITSLAEIEKAVVKRGYTVKKGN